MLQKGKGGGWSTWSWRVMVACATSMGIVDGPTSPTPFALSLDASTPRASRRKAAPCLPAPPAVPRAHRRCSRRPPPPCHRRQRRSICQQRVKCQRSTTFMLRRINASIYQPSRARLALPWASLDAAASRDPCHCPAGSLARAGIARRTCPPDRAAACTADCKLLSSVGSLRRGPEAPRRALPPRDWTGVGERGHWARTPPPERRAVRSVTAHAREEGTQQERKWSRSLSPSQRGG